MSEQTTETTETTTGTAATLLGGDAGVTDNADPKPATDTNANGDGEDAQASDAQPNADDQAGDDSEADQSKESDDEDEGAPDEYSDFTFEDGIEPDPEITPKFKEVAKELNLNQAQAQKLADLGQDLVKKMATDQASRWAETVSKWSTDAKNDKEIGGDKFDAKLSVAKKGLQAVGTPELATMLASTGFGNNPEIIRAFYKIGKLVGEDGGIVAGDVGGSAQDPAEILYPST